MTDRKGDGGGDGSTAGSQKWNSANGGSVLSWLANKTKQEDAQKSKEPQSKGAIDYLKQKTSTASSVPKPRSQQTAKPATKGPATPEGGKWVNIVQSLVKSDGPKSTSEPSVEQPSRPAEAAPSAQESRPGVRGRRRQGGGGGGGDQSAKQRRQDQQLREAQKQHEEALRTDPEYKERFQTFQELQASQAKAQAAFSTLYSQQEHLVPGSVARERIDINAILEYVANHDVVFICSDTGSGKSTTVPKALLELSPDTRVVSTQPRRTATVSVATRVAALRRENVGDDVGYWIRGGRKGDDQTRLWYMTSYTLLLHLLEDPFNPPFTHIILDEFHERQPDLEVTVALLRLCMLEGKSKFKLIIMSATLNTEDWERYFAGLNVATYKQSEPEHPIHDYLLEDTCTMLGLPYEVPTNLISRSSDHSVMETHYYIAKSLIVFLNACSHPHHAILVFLPGRGQVQQFYEWLTTEMRSRIDAIAWHSAVDLSAIQEAIKRPSSNRQKVYLATDIAEVSITLPDVVFVVDLMLVKRPMISRENVETLLHPPLVTQWISRGSVAQRRGRIGRVQQGFYFGLLPSSVVELLSEYAKPPIEHSRIDELSLHCLQVVSNPVAIFSLCHGQPLVETITTAMNTLQDLGCILSSTDPLAAGERMGSLPSREEAGRRIVSVAQSVVMAPVEEYEYTFIGRLLQLIPVSPQQGLLVFFGLLTGLESLMVLAAAVTSSLSPFSPSLQEGRMRNGRKYHNVAMAMEDTENVMRDMCCGQRSDIVAVLKAVLHYRQLTDAHGVEAPVVEQWCTQHHLSAEKLAAIVELERHIKYELANFIPFRDIDDPATLLTMLDKLAAMVVVMTNVAFVSNALEVVSEGNTYSNSKEAAVGLFSDVTAVPDIHSPSCVRWQNGDIIVPVQMTLFANKMLANFSTALASHTQFWMSLLLCTYRLRYATFCDEEGTFHVFCISYGGRERFLETDEATGYAVVEFRQRMSGACRTLRLLRENKDMDDEEFTSTVLADHQLGSVLATQRDIITSMAQLFQVGEGTTIDEVEHDGDDLDMVSLLSFSLSPPVEGAS